MTQLLTEPFSCKTNPLETDDVSAARSAVETTLTGLRELLFDADCEALQNGGEISAATARAVRQAVQDAIHGLNDLIGEDADLPDEAKAEIGRRVCTEWRPWLMLTSVANRFYTKPRGYAGDFETIRLIYGNHGGGVGPLGPIIDQAFLELDACQSCRNRRPLLCDTFRSVLESADSGPVQVTSLGSGPAEELFDLFRDCPAARECLTARCIDIDFAALDHVTSRARSLALGRQISGHRANLIRVARGQESIPIEPQDLVYSVGLIDYFDDDHVIALIDWIHSALKPGCRVLLGNLHPSNPTRAFADHVLDWKLIHRTEADMDRLFQQSRFSRGCTRIEFEPTGINLFATCTKQDEVTS